jgi:hypothetical protein
VAEQHDMNRTVPDLADGISRVVDGGAKTALGHTANEPFDSVALAPRHAWYLDQAS